METFVPGAHKSLATKFCTVAPDIFIIITYVFLTRKESLSFDMLKSENSKIHSSP
jgi:hypothetical protein